LAKACIQGRYEAKADPPKKVENDKIVESATLARHQINVTHHTGVMHLALAIALCDSLSQIRQPEYRVLTI
jgi:hypothetical protein